MKSHSCRYFGLAVAALLWTGALRSNGIAGDIGTMNVRSLAFKAGGRIPAAYTCAGADQSPPLGWNNIPIGAHSLALIVDDPDAPAGDFIHWVIYNLPVNATGLAANQPKDASLPSGARQGVNDFGHIGYDGPCPPPGPAHHYHLRLYALEDTLKLPERATAGALRQAMQGKTLATAELVATFGH